MVVTELQTDCVETVQQPITQVKQKINKTFHSLNHDRELTNTNARLE